MIKYRSLCFLKVFFILQLQVFYSIKEINPAFFDILRDEVHELYAYGGKSSISLVAGINDFDAFKCRISLIDARSCEKNIAVGFEGTLFRN